MPQASARAGEASIELRMLVDASVYFSARNAAVEGAHDECTSIRRHVRHNWRDHPGGGTGACTDSADAAVPDDGRRGRCDQVVDDASSHTRRAGADV